MVDEQTPTSDDTNPLPLPYDTVHLRPGNRFGIPPEVSLTVADIPDEAPDVYELHHQEDHPEYWDWAAGATLTDIGHVVRIVDGAVRSWTP